MEFHVPYLQMFKDMGWKTAVASRNDYENPADCVIPYCDHYYDVPFERNPFKPGNLKAYRQLKKIIDEGQYDIIHCHTPVGAMLTRLAASDAREKGTKVIYTFIKSHLLEMEAKAREIFLQRFCYKSHIDLARKVILA